MSKILVTGGCGFLGGHLVDRLLKRGYEVVVIDNLSTGKYINPESTFYKADICDKHTIENIFELEKPDLVFHLAANTNVPVSVSDPLFDFESLQGAMNVMSMGVPIIFTSSGFIYGNAKRPTKETAPFKPLAPYAITKYTIEQYLQFYGRVYGLPYLILRLATIYGPRQTGGAMPDYIRKLGAGKQAEIYGNGKKTRDYLFIDDLIDVLVRIMHIHGFKERIFNVGTGKETSLNELYFKIGGIIKKKAKPIYKPERPGELERYCLDSRRLRHLIGWKPRFSLDQGLRILCQDQEKQKKILTD